MAANLYSLKHWSIKETHQTGGDGKALSTPNTYTHVWEWDSKTNGSAKLHRIPYAHTVAQWHLSIPYGDLACATHPTCNQVRQWLSEIALATLSWVWWETGLILWWIPDLPRFRQGKNERVMPSLTHQSVSRDQYASVCIRERVREGEMRKARQTGKGAIIIPHLQVVRICFVSKSGCLYGK